MLRIKEIATAAGTLACAVGIGFVMQSSESAERIYGEQPQEDAPEQLLDLPQDAVLDVEGIELTSAELETPDALPPVQSDVVKAVAPSSTLETPEPPQSLPDANCDITANARTVAAAMVNLTLDASCLPNERVTVHHSGMVFSQMTDATGALDLTVPALAKEAVFILAFSNGDGAMAQTVVEEVDDFDRMVLQWRGDTGFQIHAREFDAEYGSDGHVWSGATRDMTAAITGVGGFLTVNGNVDLTDPLISEVYSIPTSISEQPNALTLSVEAEVTQANCDSEIEAKTLLMAAGTAIQTRDIALAVPECSAIGNFLVLPNLLPDLTVASN